MIVLHKFTSPIQYIVLLYEENQDIIFLLWLFASIFILSSFLDATVGVANSVIVYGKIIQRGTEATSETIEYIGVFAN